MAASRNFPLKIVRQMNYLPEILMKYLPELFGSLREPYAKMPFLRFSQCYNFHPNAKATKTQKGLKERVTLVLPVA
ncbi:hypothetical protein OUZ56_021372 [Daphnia magna]|uniref:Uncharacterized protein n=1 Tax=Daphnia magna TaxID=35525 RepID=A0ABQ9ZH71_9CRUS|nr:hypothetical protein OUZ56_021372 [Daphnia magna]